MIWIIMVGLLMTVLAFGVIAITRRVESRQEHLLQETLSRAPSLIQKCATVIDGAQTIGIAAIIDHQLIIHDALGHRVEVPLSKVCLKETRAGGWGPFIGKTVLHLDTPNTSRCAIGVERPEDWLPWLQKEA